MSSCVLDASALLALLNEESGKDVVAQVVADAAMSAVNFSEVVAKLADEGRSEAEIRARLDPYGLDIRLFDANLAYRAGMLRPLTRAAGLSLGDRACLALAQHLKLPVLTADRSWRDLNLGVEIRVIR